MRIITILLLLSLPFQAHSKSDTGILYCYAYDSSTLDSIVGVKVEISELNKHGGFTDHNGMTVLLNLNPGTYTVEASIEGWMTRTCDSVVIRPGTQSGLALPLQPGDNPAILAAWRELSQRARAHYLMPDPTLWLMPNAPSTLLSPSGLIMSTIPLDTTRIPANIFTETEIR